MARQYLTGFSNATNSIDSHFDKQLRSYEDSNKFQHNDITIENIAVHYRTTDFEIKGEKYLLIQEIQSDRFQKMHKAYGRGGQNSGYNQFREKTPFSGTNDWVSLAFRHALEDVVEQGDYKGIAWLDGRTQTRLEKGFDPLEPRGISARSLGEGYYQPTSKLDGDNLIFSHQFRTDWKVTVNKKDHPTFSKLLRGGGTVIQLDGDTYIDEYSFKHFMRDGDKMIKIEHGVDYSLIKGSDVVGYTMPAKGDSFVVFRKGLFKGSDFQQENGEFLYLGKNVHFNILKQNPFALFQDNIIPTAVKKQMTRNGLKANIKHNKELGFHVMPINKKSQLLIKEKGQPTYAKALPDPEPKFKPIAPTEAPKVATTNQYSSLERLIENQRPLDKRNGKQWLKYLTRQDMSLAEMKHTGVWDVLERNSTREIPKEKLIDIINKNQRGVTSYEIQVEGMSSEALAWKNVINEEIKDKSNDLYNRVNSGLKDTHRVFKIQDSSNGEFTILKAVPPPNSASLRAKYFIHSATPDTIGIVVSPTASDARHNAQQLWDAMSGRSSGTDWRNITIEAKGIILNKYTPENYREVLIQLEDVDYRNLARDGSVASSMRALVGSHFRDGFRSVRQKFPKKDLDLANTIVHYRATDYYIDGKKYLLIQEIQSDVFQKMQKAATKLGEIYDPYRDFLADTPYSGTNNWVALAIRDSIDKIVDEGDYKGIAWLDGRTQTRLEHGYDPELPDQYFGNTLFSRFLKETNVVVSSEGTTTKIKRRTSQNKKKTIIEIILNTESNKDFIKLLNAGGDVGVVDPGISKLSSILSVKIGGKSIQLVEGVDYIKSLGNTPNPNVLVAFRKGLFTDNYLIGSKEFESNIIFFVKKENKFAVYQDKIIPTAVTKQMKHNGLKTTIKHNKELGFHVMDIDEKAQLLIKEKGQPTYAKAIPSFKPIKPSESPTVLREKVKSATKQLDKNIVEREKALVSTAIKESEEKVLTSQLKDLEKRVAKFKPIAPSESPTSAAPVQYSSLERLIKSQRPLDKRNGKQWRKYLIGQGMSEAEMRYTGVWELLEKNKITETTKETLLATMSKNRADVKSYEAQDVGDFLEQSGVVLEWDDPINKKSVSKTDGIYKEINATQSFDSEVFVFQHSKNGEFTIIKAVPPSSKQSKHPILYYLYETQNRVLAVENPAADASTIRHYGQDTWNSWLGEEAVVAKDWRSLTIESQKLVKKDFPENYREVLIQLPGARDKLQHFKSDDLVRAVETTLLYHFRDEFERISSIVGEITVGDTIVHYRVSDYIIDDKNYLLIQEIQSDYFQKVKKLRGPPSRPSIYKKFREKTPFSGTNDWVSLAIRDAISKVAEDGDYKGIAWLDGRMQTRLEKSYDPDIPLAVSPTTIFEEARHTPIIKVDKDKLRFQLKITLPDPSWVTINKKDHPEFYKLSKEGGSILKISEFNHRYTEGRFVSIRRDGVVKPLVAGVDFKMLDGVNEPYLNFVVFRKGLFKESDFDAYYGKLNSISDLQVELLLKQENQFALFQDNIIPTAVKKQMTRNGLKANIKHNKELGFHVMDIDEKSQLLIKEKGQPTYAKALPDPEPKFKPLAPTMAPKRIVDPVTELGDAKGAVLEWVRHSHEPWRRVYYQAEINLNAIARSDKKFKAFDSVFTKYEPDYSGEMYRVLTSKLELKAGDLISDAAPSSASASRVGIRQFVMMGIAEIKSHIVIQKSDKPFAYNIQKVGDYGEDEVLIPPKAVLKVVSVRRNVSREGIGKVDEYVVKFVEPETVNDIALKRARLVSTRLTIEANQKNILSFEAIEAQLVLIDRKLDALDALEKAQAKVLPKTKLTKELKEAIAETNKILGL